MCSWESSQPPKLADGVRLLALVLADVAEQLGIGFVNRSMLVRIQPSAPYLDSVTDRRTAVPDFPKVQVLVRFQVEVLKTSARECAGSHASFRSCWTRFDSWTGYLRFCQ